MNALANRAFTKMNGLGNEIVVVDMREQPAAIGASETRAAAGSVAFDQIMALYPPRTPGTDAYVRIYNNDGSESGACGNGMRCIAALVCAGTGKDAAREQAFVTGVLRRLVEEQNRVYWTAEALGEEDIANLLRENLEQEEHTLKEVDEKARKLTQATVGAAR